jgi:peptidoglycan-N-acetylglucosamine deacetylase
MNLFAKVFTIVVATFCIGTVSAQFPLGSSSQKRMQPGAELERGSRQHRRIALTFDAGGSSEDLPGLLRVLENENVTATFFLTGKWVREYPACASQIATRGHVIGNQTWGHKDLTKLTDGEIAQELLRADDLFVSAFGCRYLPLFRAPFGEVDSRVLRVVDKLGFRAIRWSIDTLDSMEPRKTPSFIEHRILDRSDEELCGSIVLMHVGYPETIAALPVIIHNLRERGFEFVPVTSWVAMPLPTLTNAEIRLNGLEDFSWRHAQTARSLHRQD